MIEENLLNEIFKLNEKAKEEARRYKNKRFIFKKIFDGTGKAFIGIAGSRGAGKTVLLKQKLLEEKDSVYVSVDAFGSLNIYELAETLKERYGIKTLFFDEIHYAKNWQSDFKKIYDFLNMKIYFTSSVSIDVVHSKHDLGRRIIIKTLHPFSFREFLFFYKKILEKPFKITDINNVKLMQKISRHDLFFSDYMHGGLMPAYLEEKDFAIFSNILDRIIEKDLVHALSFTGKDINNIKIMLEYIANAGIDDVSYSSIAKNTGITKYTAIRYVDALEKAFVLNVVKPLGSNVLKEPKIMFVPPYRLRYLKKDFKESLGIFREEFFVESMKIIGKNIFYLKSRRGEKKPDYLISFKNQKYVFEIGGKQKTRTQLKTTNIKHKYILAYPSNTKNPYRPLVASGFLEETGIEVKSEE